MFAIAGRVKDLPSKALAVACGGVHTACITVDGLYVWGLNEEGQLGFPPDKGSHVLIPRLISRATATFVQVVCGAHHTAALTSTGIVYAWGYNHKGQVAADPTTVCAHEPRRVGNVHNVRHLACGDEHTAVLTNDGVCVTWGGNDYGQLGTNAAPFAGPAVVTDLSNACFVTALACGTHSTAVCDDVGDVYVWGRLLAPGQTANQRRPRRLDCARHLFVTRVACGVTHMALLVNRDLTDALRHFKRATIFHAEIGRAHV